jgi:D-glycero-alpha-D-manno-heptose-7-phosphate kinase
VIITKAPFRISFAGGGSDLESFYSNNGYGAVVSTSIDKYMYIMLHPYFNDKIRIKYSKLEDVDNINEISHPIVREALKFVNIQKGVEIASIADVPAGTGLGSSSSFTVALLHALHAFQNKYISKEYLAQKACEIEIGILKEPIGKQDQYAASYGGLSYIKFNPDGSVFVEPLICNPDLRKRLFENLLMFYVGNDRKASSILNEQNGNMKKTDKSDFVKKLVQLADDLKDSLNQGDIKSLGKILHAGWNLKKQLANGISNPELDRIYETALNSGATGGKLLGAGGGGFFLFYCEKKYQSSLREALKLKELVFDADLEGSKLIYFNN